MRLRFAVAVLSLAVCPVAHASTLVIGGVITQSTADGTGPAVSNPSLNGVMDAETFQVTLTSTAPVTGPGFYDLTGSSSLLFTVPAAGASEGGFAATSLSVTQDGGYLDFSLYGCLADADCSIGNALSASFSIPAGSVGGTNVAATGLDEPHPLELLEDDGITDLHGSITSYSNTALVSTPEPGSGTLMVIALLGTALVGRRNVLFFSRRLQ